MNKWTKSILALLAVTALAAWTVPSYPESVGQDGKGEPLTIRKLLQSAVGKPCMIGGSPVYVWIDYKGGESKIAFVGEDFFKITSGDQDSYIPIAAIEKIITRDE